MTVLLFLVPIALVVTLFAIYMIFWSIKNDQFEDLETRIRKNTLR